MVASNIILADNGLAAPSFDVSAYMDEFHAGAGMVRRGDSISWNVERGASPYTAMAAYRQRHNAHMFQQQLELKHGMQGRRDAFDPQAGWHLAGDLEHTLTTVLREEHPLETATELFTLDSTIPVGATDFRATRMFESGQARVHGFRGGSRVNRVSVQRQTEKWPIHPLTCGFGWNLFEAQSDSFSGSNRTAELQRISRNAIDRLANKIWWGLDDEGEPYGLYGVINHPFLNTVDIAVDGSRASLTADPDGALQALHQLIDFPAVTYRGVWSPTDVAMTSRMRLRLAETEMADGRDRLLLERFIMANPHIGSEANIHTADELRDAGGAGIDGVLAFRRDERGIKLPMPQGVTMLPAFQIDPLNWEVVMWASIGGAWMPEPRNQVLGLWDSNA